MKLSPICVVACHFALCLHANGQSGIITTVAGNGNAGFAGDGGAATSATIHTPDGVAVDAAGNIFIADSANNRVRKVSPGGTITTVAGNGTAGFSGDGGPATSASLNEPAGLAVDASGNLFIADFANNRIRKVSVGGAISTVAGSGATGFNKGGFGGDGGPATSALLNVPEGVAVDASGNLFIAEGVRIRKVSVDGTITTVAGNGFSGYSGDAGPATSAELFGPAGVAVDPSGNIFIADASSNRVREVSAAGIISTVAGSGATGYNLGGFSGDGGPAAAASLDYPEAVYADTSGNLFIADSFNQRIRKVAANGFISTVAGNGTRGFSGDGGSATAGSLFQPSGIAVDGFGNLLVADTFNNRIRKVTGASAASVTVTPANIALALVTGASSTQLITLNTSSAGLTWSANASSNWITLSPGSGTGPGIISAAIGTAALQPGAYTATITIQNPQASPTQETVTVSLNVTSAGAMLSVAPSTLSFEAWQGAPAQSQSIQVGGTSGTAWKATAAASDGGGWLSTSPAAGSIPGAVAAVVNSAGLMAGTYQGSISIAAPGATPSSSQIGVTLTVTARGGPGVITTVAGGVDPANRFGNKGDGGPATSAVLTGPVGIALDAAGNYFISDLAANRIAKVSTSGIITTYAGVGPTGFPGGFSGDGGPAISASIYQARGIAVDSFGNLLFADSYNKRIRKVSPSGIITTAAGNGAGAPDQLQIFFSGDGGPATSAELSFPFGIAADASGNFFIADTNNQRIRKVSASGVITTVAGNPTTCIDFAVPVFCPGFSGDGGPAASALMNGPTGVTVDGTGNLFIADQGNNRIRKVSPSGIITTFAGNGTAGFSGDGGPAASASLNLPFNVRADGSGNVLIVDSGNNRIRKVSASGIITTIAGNGIAGFSGDGGPATSASLSEASDVAVDASGNLYIADAGNNRIREVMLPPSASVPAPLITSGRIVPIYSSTNTIQPGEWISIFGSNLASTTMSWSGDFPTSLGGTSVTINGKPAYLIYVSPTQINLQTPFDSATGPVSVVVTTPGGTATSTVTLAQFGPSFCLLDATHVTAIILPADGSGKQGGGSYDILGPTGNSLGYPTVAAKAGDTVALFAVGLGPTNPAVPAGQAYSGAAQTTNSVSLSINKTNVIPTFAGISSAGLYQINLVVPAGLGTGDVPLTASVGGVQTPAGVVISLQ